MATRRIKEITNTATTFASDDFIALDGTTQGTRKMDKDDLIAEVSAGVSGDYLEEANNLSDVASVDTSKLNLEVPDVGTAPNEVPLNGQLGSMAYQSADSVSVGTLEADGRTTLTNDQDNALVVETTNKNPMYVNVVGSAPNYLFDVRDDGTSKFRVNGSGNVIASGDVATSTRVAADTINGYTGGSTPLTVQTGGTQNLILGTNATTAVTIDTSQRVGIGISSPGDTLSVFSSNTGRTGVSVGNTTTGGRTYILGSVGSATDGGAAAGSFTIRDGNASANRVTIDSSGNMTINSGNLVIGTSGKGIDFGSVAGGTGTPATDAGLLNDFERGSFTPSFTSTGTAPTLTYLAQVGTYTKVGNLVTCHGRVRVNAVTGAGTGSLRIAGLPFATQNVSNLGSGGAVCLAAFFGTSSSGCPTHISGGNNATVMTLKTLKNSAGVVASLDSTDAADLASSCYVDFSITYTTA